jgi:arabinose-5-phosphate isomerase
MSKYKKFYNEALALQIQGLESLAEINDKKFAELVELIIKNKNKIIFAGMGKSGHIATKISSTFSSLGIPSFAIHPGEASHGDLGMISKGDLVILLSNSGDTVELQDVIQYCLRNKIDLVSFVRNKHSYLVKVSKISIIMPNIAECSNVNAPTTSTTQMLVYGDLLAVAIAQSKGFNKADFGLLHPGGKLGKINLKVKDLMRSTESIPFVNCEQKLIEVIFEITNKMLGFVLVQDDNKKFMGVISDGDLRRHYSKNFQELKARDIMSKNPITINEDLFVSDAVNILFKNQITNLVVLNKANVVGILNLHDCLNAGFNYGK